MWEEIDKNTHRMKVIGGWIVRTTIMWVGKNSSMAVSSSFVPDETHSWTLKKD